MQLYVVRGICLLLEILKLRLCFPCNFRMMKTTRNRSFSGLAIDVFTRTVYWADRYLEVLSVIDYDKSFRKREVAAGGMVIFARSIWKSCLDS